MSDEGSTGAIRYSAVDDDGFRQCGWCGTTFGTDNGQINDELNLMHGPVVRADTGTELAAVIDGAPEIVLVHPECWVHVETVREAIKIGRRSNENASLEEFV